MSKADLPSGQVLAADIGGSFIKMIATDTGSGRVRERTNRPTPAHDLTGFVDSVAQMVDELSDAVTPDAPLVIAAAGLVDPESGVMTVANIPCLDGQRPGALLAERIGRRVEVLNDADAFALAEARLGAGRGHAVVFGAVIGTGIGGGLVCNGQIVRGAQGIAGEWGHGPIASQIPRALGRPLPRMRCGCGRQGCADTFGGARGLERLHAAIGHGNAGSRAIVEQWRGGEGAARETVAVWAEMLSEPLALTINATGASIVPVGGGLGLVADLIAVLDGEVRRRALFRSATAIVVPAQLQGEAGLLGAALLGAQVSRASP